MPDLYPAGSAKRVSRGHIALVSVPTARGQVFQIDASGRRFWKMSPLANTEQALPFARGAATALNLDLFQYHATQPEDALEQPWIYDATLLYSTPQVALHHGGHLITVEREGDDWSLRVNGHSIITLVSVRVLKNASDKLSKALSGSVASLPLREAVRNIIQNWEHGDLAAAVRLLVTTAQVDDSRKICHILTMVNSGGVDFWTYLLYLEESEVTAMEAQLKALLEKEAITSYDLTPLLEVGALDAIAREAFFKTLSQ